MTISSSFDSGLEGWTTTNSTEVFDVAGKPDGSISGAEGGSGVWYYVAPAAYHGDLGKYYGGTITFDLIQPSASNQFDDDDIIITSTMGNLAIDAGPNPGTTWTNYAVDLELGAGWRVNDLNGAIASEQYIRDVLANVTGFLIRGEFVSGSVNDESSLDNVVIEEGPANNSGYGLGPVISSTFDNDLEGWSFIEDVEEFRHEPTNGNPGGHLFAEDFASGQVYYFIAPDAYLGNKSAFYDGTLSFDLKQSALDSQFDSTDIFLIGGGLTLALDFAHPGVNWTSYSISLNTSADWRLIDEDGVVASEAQLRAALTDLTEIRIRGEFRTGEETSYMDNVKMSAGNHVELSRGPSQIDVAQTLEAALDNALSGDVIKISVAALPTETAGSIIIKVDDLTIFTPEGYMSTLELSGSAQQLTLTGLGDVDVLGNTVADTILANDGDNNINSGEGADRVEGAKGDDEIKGGLGNDTLLGQVGRDSIEGGKGDDVLNGAKGHDLLEGGKGHDKLLGGKGDDTLLGDKGNDTLKGEKGDDRLEGGLGDDTIWGGNGVDQFVFDGDSATGTDLIRDFNNNSEIIEINGATVFADLTVTKISGDTHIEWSGNTIILEGITGTINANDFDFSG
ncbi:laminin B domain-containing protein [Planktotalea sp.]|uniref:laminin B domain-containing protein n=1 Tax=Planktotalea sp. TaxID=2029877 RepID=UPI003D6A1C13